MYNVAIFTAIVYVLFMAGWFWWMDRHLYVKVIKGQLVANRTFICAGKEIQKNTRGAIIPEGVKIPRNSVKFWIGERTTLVGDCVIEDGVYIGNGCLIDNSTIHKGVVVLSQSVIYNCNIANDCRIGFSCYIEKTTLHEKCVLGNNADVVECVFHDRVTTQGSSFLDVVIYSNTLIEHGVNIENSIVGERVVIGRKSCIIGCTLPENTVYCIDGGVFIRYGVVLTAHEFGHVYHMIQAVDGYYLVGTGIKVAVPMKNEQNVPEHLRRVYSKFIEFMPREC